MSQRFGFDVRLSVSKSVAQKLKPLCGLIDPQGENMGQACNPETAVGEEGPQPDPRWVVAPSAEAWL